MLDKVQPDILDIITPPATHLAFVREAAQRGITTICQKPIAPTLSEAQALVEVAEDAGILLVIHENFRFMPWFRRVRQFIDQGQLGDLHSIMFRLRTGDGQGPCAYLDRQPYLQQMERFLIHETGIHFIDTFRYLFGEVTSVYAMTRKINPVIAGEDAAYLLFEFANQASGLFDGSRLNDHLADDCRLTFGEMLVEGSAGVLRLDGFGRIWWRPHGGGEKELAYSWRNRNFSGDCVFHFQRHVIDHLSQGTPIENLGRAYLKNYHIEEAVYRSAQEHRRVPIRRDCCKHIA
jgi:predicted dehydrogenase